MLEEKTGRSLVDIAGQVKALVLTLGAHGSVIHAGDARHEIPTVTASAVVDPTGCGDAYRGGLLHALSSGAGWTDAARLGSVMGAIKIEHQGAQNHRIDRDEVARRFAQAYGRAPW